jgi:signal transduction histidine kinase
MVAKSPEMQKVREEEVKALRKALFVARQEAAEYLMELKRLRSLLSLLADSVIAGEREKAELYALKAHEYLNTLQNQEGGKTC